MTCLLSGLDNRPGRFAHPRPGRPPPPIWDPPPPTPPGWDHAAGRMITPVASKVKLAAPPSSSTAPALKPAPPAASSFASKDLPLKASKIQQYLGGCRQYACSEVLSEGSAWKKEMLQNSGQKSMASKGLLKNDITYAHANTAGVCVLRTMSLPNIPPPAQQEGVVKFLKREVGRKEREDARASRAFAAQKALLAQAGQGGGEGAVSSEVLPKHQRRTSGKPAICRRIDTSREAVAKMFNAEDSHFTSEYRAHGWWKQLSDTQKREMKEHVRPYDNWTMFRDAAAEVNKFSRFPINTY